LHDEPFLKSIGTFFDKMVITSESQLFRGFRMSIFTFGSSEICSHWISSDLKTPNLNTPNPSDARTPSKNIYFIQVILLFKDTNKQNEGGKNLGTPCKLKFYASMQGNENQKRREFRKRSACEINPNI
jgi:hypothetical protein